SLSTRTGSSTAGGGQFNSILDLFGSFSQMTLTTSYVDFYSGEVQDSGVSHLSYAVLGQGALNSTNHYKVEFTNLDAKSSEIAWFNQQGSIDRLDVLGDKNYTGPTAPLLAKTFVTSFSQVLSLSNNSTLLPALQKTAEGVKSIGPTQMDVTTYGLTAPSSAYSNFTVKIATVTGANLKLAVYLFQEDPSTSNTSFEVTSVTRA
ncbi:MAG: hypothetical protein OK455_06910, partial [Thaumarchaeota archaeon]|nr:hypothetical protein [Nitrososphaerota archaeon]